MSYVAFVEKLHQKSGTARNGRPYTLYSLKLQSKNGEVLPGWFQCGFQAPACKEGDFIKLEATPKGDNFEVVAGSIQVSKNPPVKPASPVQEPAQGRGGAAAPKRSTKSERFGEIGGYNTEDDIARMTYSAARGHAIEVAKLLIAEGGIKLVKSDTKAGAASRFDLITETIDKLTVVYFNDSAGLRKLDTIADVEPDTEGDGPLPDAEEDEGFEDADDFATEGEDDGDFE